ncbi:hypothetical protein B0H66DRAFT_628783 [Apodospora peruviana]|uniref:Citrate transporter-like domain-containing protein n=1 Tax=Apodospora peruviana TaxID=516989 RepID=A0AAE0M1Q1_9PEZI|nr:hypothetical protein B0H66DRAFT_628783 [Apodospora peruviana]
MSNDLGNADITQWRPILTLVVFIITNIIVIATSAHIPIYVYRPLFDAFFKLFVILRFIPPRLDGDRDSGRFVRLKFPVDMRTVPLTSVLFLLSVSAIGQKEVREGTLGANNISPIDIVVFAFTMGYITTSIAASGFIRWATFKVTQAYGESGHRLFFFLYLAFFIIGCVFGNDAVIYMGVVFVSSLSHLSSNIVHPRAWIHMQFAISNISSAILVSSNTTNVVIAQAFQIGFGEYTANVVVPVVVTVVVLFPYLLYIVFANESLIPISIRIHELSEIPANPEVSEDSEDPDDPPLLLQFIVNPFLDKGSAAVGVILMASTLVVLLALTAVSIEVPVFWATLPAAFIKFCWDIALGWIHRHETRELARRGEDIHCVRAAWMASRQQIEESATISDALSVRIRQGATSREDSDATHSVVCEDHPPETSPHSSPVTNRPTIKSHLERLLYWSKTTFPSATVVVSHLPFPLVPFALPMFILVQALVSTGWILEFAHGWDQWVRKTGTVGAIAGMGFLSVILSNFAGTNIGAAVLLSRILQEWAQIHAENGMAISSRTYWGTVYALAIGVNYGAFSLSFGASLAGQAWREELARKHIHVRLVDFARVNFPVIVVAMVISCSVLVGEVYIVRDDTPYIMRSS